MSGHGFEQGRIFQEPEDKGEILVQLGVGLAPPLLIPGQPP